MAGVPVSGLPLVHPVMKHFDKLSMTGRSVIPSFIPSEVEVLSRDIPVLEN